MPAVQFLPQLILTALSEYGSVFYQFVTALSIDLQAPVTGGQQRFSQASFPGIGATTWAGRRLATRANWRGRIAHFVNVYIS